MTEMILISIILICLLAESVALSNLQKQIDKLRIEISSQRIVYTNNQAKMMTYIQDLNKVFGKIDTNLTFINEELRKEAK